MNTVEAMANLLLMTRMWLRKSRFSKSSRKSGPGMGCNGTDTLPLEQHRVYTPSPVASRCQYRAPQCGHTHSIRPQSCAKSPSLTSPIDPPGTKNEITPRRWAPVVRNPSVRSPPPRPVHLCVSADLSHQMTLAHCVPQVRQCCGAITSRTSRRARECHDCQRPVYKSHRHIETPGRTKLRPVCTRCQHTATVRVSSP